MKPTPKLYRRNVLTQSEYDTAYMNWYWSLQADHQEAVYDYTDGGYKKINSYLRFSDSLNDANLNRKILLLNEALIEGESSSLPKLLFRGVKELETSLKEGDLVTMKAFTSTSSDPHQVFKFIDKESPIVFEFQANFAREVSDIHNEFEFLIPPNSTFTVTKVLGNMNWHAEYPETDYSRGMENVTVLQLAQNL
jgi:hypothetical protein